MLTIKQITEDTDKVIRGLEKKHLQMQEKQLQKCLN